MKTDLFPDQGPRVINKFRKEYFFLSNFYPCRVSYFGRVYPTSENAYQAAKTLDPNIRNQLQYAKPVKAKSIGQGLGIRSDWEAIKDGAMAICLYNKFRDNPDIRSQLKATGDKLLLEGNTRGDTYWGVCRGVGENRLGQLLMLIRSEL